MFNYTVSAYASTPQLVTDDPKLLLVFPFPGIALGVCFLSSDLLILTRISVYHIV
jgi:hypothetical protein